jgi:hypothetical protein
MMLIPFTAIQSSPKAKTRRMSFPLKLPRLGETRTCNSRPCQSSRYAEFHFLPKLITHRLSQRAQDDTVQQIKKGNLNRPDEELTIASLVAKKDSGAGILNPRAYQIELFERAKTRNIIAVLDTGERFRLWALWEDF